MVPVRLFPKRRNDDTELNDPNAVGIEPVNIFRSKNKAVVEDKLPKIDGIVLVKLFKKSLRTTSFVNDPKPVGIEPPILFVLKSKLVRDENDPMSFGYSG